MARGMMATLEWMRREFHYGYDSGDVLSAELSAQRASEEKKIGGSYAAAFEAATRSGMTPTSKVLELGPGRGSWTRAILHHLTTGTLDTVDFQDITRWINPTDFGGRLRPHQNTDLEYGFLPDGNFDFMFTWGVFCHWNQTDIETILSRLLSKMRPGGRAFCEYAAWDKLDAYGWEKGDIPVAFRDLPDNEMWWPRNSVSEMKALCERAGWRVLEADIAIVARDGVCLLEAP